MCIHECETWVYRHPQVNILFFVRLRFLVSIFNFLFLLSFRSDEILLSNSGEVEGWMGWITLPGEMDLLDGHLSLTDKNPTE